MHIRYRWWFWCLIYFIWNTETAKVMSLSYSLFVRLMWLFTNGRPYTGCVYIISKFHFTSFLSLDTAVFWFSKTKSQCFEKIPMLWHHHEITNANLKQWEIFYVDHFSWWQFLRKLHFAAIFSQSFDKKTCFVIVSWATFCGHCFAINWMRRNLNFQW